MKACAQCLTFLRTPQFGCRCIWCAAVGDADRPTSLGWLEARSDHHPQDEERHTAEVALRCPPRLQGSFRFPSTFLSPSYLPTTSFWHVTLQWACSIATHCLAEVWALVLKNHLVYQSLLLHTGNGSFSFRKDASCWENPELGLDFDTLQQRSDLILKGFQSCQSLHLMTYKLFLSKALHEVNSKHCI